MGAGSAGLKQGSVGEAWCSASPTPSPEQARPPGLDVRGVCTDTTAPDWPTGEIGRRSRLKICRSQGRLGSSPRLATSPEGRRADRREGQVDLGERMMPSTNATAQPQKSFIAVTQELAAAAGPDGLTVANILDRLDERAFGLLILIFALPCLVPGLPGAQIIAIPIFLLALQLAFGRKEPWLPGWVMRMRARKEWLDGIAGFATKRLAWTQKLARPRLGFFASGVGERGAALILAVAAVTIMLPITNTIPSTAITLMAIGLLQRDGLFVAGGALVALAWAGLLGAVVYAIATGAGALFEWAQANAPWLVDLIR